MRLRLRSAGYQQYEFSKIQEEVKKLAHEVGGDAPACHVGHGRLVHILSWHALLH